MKDGQVILEKTDDATEKNGPTKACDNKEVGLQQPALIDNDEPLLLFDNDDATDLGSMLDEIFRSNSAQSALQGRNWATSRICIHNSGATLPDLEWKNSESKI